MERSTILCDSLCRKSIAATEKVPILTLFASATTLSLVRSNKARQLDSSICLHRPAKADRGASSAASLTCLAAVSSQSCKHLDAP